MSHARHNAHSTYVIGRFASSRVARFRLRAGVFVRAHGSARMPRLDRLERADGEDIPLRFDTIVGSSRRVPSPPWRPCAVGARAPAPGARPARAAPPPLTPEPPGGASAGPARARCTLHIVYVVYVQ
jgi:hypothetical protein